MNEILEFLIKHCSFLYSTAGYRFVDSSQSKSFGNAVVILESGRMRLRFIRDRSQLFLDIQALNKNHSNADWFSIDIVRRLLTGKRQEAAELSAEQANFIHEHLEEIEDLFGEDRIAETTSAMRELERIRAKELFG